MAPAVRCRLDHRLDHRPAIELEKQLLRAMHARARACGEDHGADWEQSIRQAVEWWRGGADPFDLGFSTQSDLREIAEPRAVRVDEEHAAPGENAQVTIFFGQADHRHRPAIVALCDML